MLSVALWKWDEAIPLARTVEPSRVYVKTMPSELMLANVGRPTAEIAMYWPNSATPSAAGGRRVCRSVPHVAAIALVDVRGSLVAHDDQAVAKRDRAPKPSVRDGGVECLDALQAARRLIQHRNAAAMGKRNADESDAVAHRDSVAEE